jgi:hypothetical protein
MANKKTGKSWLLFFTTTYPHYYFFFGNFEERNENENEKTSKKMAKFTTTHNYSWLTTMKNFTSFCYQHYALLYISIYIN